MWPSRVDALEQTVAVEAQVEDLYAEALHRWAPLAMAAVLPTLGADVITADGSELPPDPDAVASTQKAWDALVVASILPGVAEIWTAAAAEAAAVDMIGATTEGAASVAGVVVALASTKDDFVDTYGIVAKAVPGRVRDNLRSLVANAPQSMSLTDLRASVRDAVTPGSALLRKTSRMMGYHGSSILNHALMAVAKHAGNAVSKAWLSRRDSRVRDSHFLADGQVVAMDGSFVVGGAHMAFPGDPRGPAREVFGCRCRLVALAEGQRMSQWHVSAAEARKRAERGVVREDEQQPLVAAVAEEGNDMTETVESPTIEQAELFRTFTDQPIAFIGVPTSDRRLLAKEIALTYRQMPLPLMWVRQTSEGHSGSVTVGVIEAAHHDDGERVLASGYLLNTPEADEVAGLLAHGVARPSIDMGRVDWVLTDGDGNELTEEQWWELPHNAQVFTTFTSGELMGMTLVSTPAFGDTALHLNDVPESRSPALLSAASEQVVPRVYPAGHFTDPGLPEPTLPTLLDDGRVVGHIACWGQCHRGTQAECIIAPHSTTGYQHFHTSPAVRTDDGNRLAVGRLTVGCGHASPALAPIPAQAHYDDAGTCWALVRVGEDRHGIWFSGVTAPWATPEQIEAGLAAPLSGDWRDFGQGLELVAALSVNTPGFAARGREHTDGRPAALVAALGPGPHALGGNAPSMTREDIKAAVAEALAEARFTAERDAVLAAAARITQPKTAVEEIDELLAQVRG